MTITQTDATLLPKYEIRTFSLLNDDYPNEERFIRHYYFISWPDHGTPYAHELLAFIRRVDQGIMTFEYAFLKVHEISF